MACAAPLLQLQPRLRPRSRESDRESTCRGACEVTGSSPHKATGGAEAQACWASGGVCAGEHGRADPALQLDALGQAGCWRVFTDHASGGREDRPELVAALESLWPGDTLVVWRLGWSLPHLIETVTGMRERGWGSGR